MAKGSLTDYLTGKQVPDEPEEHVLQALAQEVVEVYGYPKQRVRRKHAVQMGSDEREADLVIFLDDRCRKAHIVAETKAPNKKRGLAQGKSYAASLRARYVLWTNGTDRAAWDMEADEEIGDVPAAHAPKKALVYGNDVGLDLRLIPDARDFRVIMGRCHDALRNIDHKTLDRAFEIMSRILYARIWDEMNTPSGAFYSFQAGYGETIGEVADRARRLYDVARQQEPTIFPADLGVTEDKTLLEIARILGPWSLVRTDLEVKGEAYQEFLDVRLRGEWGQYFTPRTVVKTMVEMADPDERTRILDPAVGSGGFLVYAIYHVRDKLEKGYGKNPSLFLRRMYDFAHYSLFGIEVDDRILQAAMSNMILNEDAHGHIMLGDALQDWPVLKAAGIHRDEFDMILTNPPLGIRESRPHILNNFELGKGLQEQVGHVLFLERGLEALKPGGLFCTIISEDVLERSPYVISWIERHANIRAVVSLPREAFIPYGPNAKTNILLLQKKGGGATDTGVIFMAEAINVGFDKSGKATDTNDLPQIVAHWQEFQEGEHEEDAERRMLSTEPLVFVANRAELGDRIDVKYTYLRFLDDLVTELEEQWRDAGYEVKTFGEITRLVGQVISASADERYNFLSIHFDGTATSKGLIKTKYAELLKVATGDLVMSRIDVLDGAVALVPQELDGGVVSKEFFVFRPRRGVDSIYLWLVLRSDYFRAMTKGLSTGVTGRHRVKWHELAPVRIPVPPPDVQKRLAQGVARAVRLAGQAREEMGAAEQQAAETIGFQPS